MKNDARHKAHKRAVKAFNKSRKGADRRAKRRAVRAFKEGWCNMLAQAGHSKLGVTS